MTYYQDETVTLHHGDALEVLRGMESGSVDCCVTSPPYFGLRDYGVTGQIGAEKSPAEFVERLRELFAEVRRVLADDGTMWLNLGDSYSGIRGNTQPAPDTLRAGRVEADTPTQFRGKGAARKNLLGIPWRTAFSLQDDGWILRNSIIWAKPNAMPESVTDRLSTRHENLFLFSKRRKYWFDLDPIRQEVTDRRADEKTWEDRKTRGELTGANRGPSRIGTPGAFAGGTMTPNPLGRNPGDVWTIPTQPFPGSHFAVFPPELPRRCILAGCKPGGTVLDPFSGSGTTGMVAQQLGRKYVGIDLNADYLDLSLRTRLADGTFNFDEGGAA